MPHRTPVILSRTLSLIDALNSVPVATTEALIEKTGLPTASLSRHLMTLRRDFGMRIVFYRDIRSPAGGGSGFYVIHDWGVFDRKKYLAHREAAAAKN